MCLLLFYVMFLSWFKHKLSVILNLIISTGFQGIALITIKPLYRISFIAGTFQRTHFLHPRGVPYRKVLLYILKNLHEGVEWGGGRNPHRIQWVRQRRSSLKTLFSILLLYRAAFQFGIKMQEGRKTRTKLGQMSEKQKLDREWQQISNVR